MAPAVPWLALVLRAGVTKSEMVLWHRQYLDCCKELNQWDVVNEYAKVSTNGKGRVRCLGYGKELNQGGVGQ